jgi:hypothetical protein
MSKRNVSSLGLCITGVIALMAGSAHAQRTNGPDVIVGELPDFSNYGQVTVGGVAYSAFAVGTTSCNKGNTPLDWYDDANSTPGVPQSWWNRHPVIGQNMYRYKVVNGAGTFEQIGQSWLKHGFTALQGNACSLGCTANPNGDRLGVGCSDPYSSGLNGSQGSGDLGPKSQVDANTGIFPFPPQYNAQMTIANLLSRRLVVRNSDLDATLNPGSLFYVEGHYVTPDDAGYVNGATEPQPGLRDNDNNNASFRRVNVTFSTGQNRFNIALISGQSTQRERSAPYAWFAAEQGVVVNTVAVPVEGGQFVYAYKVTQVGAEYHYEYVIQNLNSDRSGHSFKVNYPAGNTACITPSSVGFRDVDYHSGEIYDNTDWVSANSASGFQWNSTQTFAQNPNANALRWSTMYTFRFRSAQAPVMGTGTLGFFKPGAATDPNSVDFSIMVPGGCPIVCDNIDFNGDGLFPDTGDIDDFLSVFSGGPCSTGTCGDLDFNNDGLFPDTTDIDSLLSVFSGGGCL